MDRVVRELLERRMAWVTMPALTEVLPQVMLEYRRVLAGLDMKDLERDRYAWRHADTEELDDGFILKHPDKIDPSRQVHGQLSDDKIFLQYRLRTEEEMRRRPEQWRDDFVPLFRMLDDVRRELDGVIERVLAELNRLRPGLQLTHKASATVIRCMTYRGERPGQPGVAGKAHLDKNDLTLHLYDSCPGLFVELGDSRERIETRAGQALVFVSKRFEQVWGVPALRHGAFYNQDRGVIVAFVHFRHPDEK